ncbi:MULTISPECIES: short chain dehydrogenase [unclassified Duganella]|uniref:short chain dehydrogenase n=1 Tax=unclassified Duganella TaxID=2636909 RepID=UPI000890F567|nr:MULTISPECIES: short chain dehydrogenase [unclassified Duganella]SDF98866.1 NAD(P)-dependent dehydrogenase, short-chain alcohol dehydrogenase family [Duganella sp. OV458]SDJ05994.1 NAD(P)-dependent dehydrogenase, short-chain alcohol dehydrogenase family [Duganella sp. OV510]
MKVIVIGATGAVGKAVVSELGQRHEVVTVGARGGQHQVDFADIASVRALFAKVGKVDAVVVAAGKLHFAPLTSFTPEQFYIGLNSKLMGQVHVALVAQEYLNDGGSITLTSGIVADEPIRHGASATMVNAAIEGFVRGAAIELPRGLRINVVSPTVLQESMDSYGPFFVGFEPIAASRAALSYARSVDGAQTGQIYRAW